MHHTKGIALDSEAGNASDRKRQTRQLRVERVRATIALGVDLPSDRSTERGLLGELVPARIRRNRRRERHSALEQRLI